MAALKGRSQAFKPGSLKEYKIDLEKSTLI